MIPFEELTAGRVIPLGRYEVSREEVLEFAEEFDPQPFHLDEEAAKETMLGGLSASGWHTCAMMMRLMAEALMLKTRCQGSPGVEFVKWKRPVRPDDTLTGAITILSSRRSASRPSSGLVGISTRIVNQNDETVLESDSTILVGLGEETAS